MGHSPPGSSVHEISQARMLEWVAISFSRGSSQPLGSNPCLPHWQVGSLPLSHQGSQESENQTLGFITDDVALEKMDLERDHRGAFCTPSLSGSKRSGGHNWACRVDQLRITASQWGWWEQQVWPPPRAPPQPHHGQAGVESGSSLPARWTPRGDQCARLC